MIEPIHKEIGGRIRAARTQVRLSQSDVAEIIGRTGAFVSQIENGQVRLSLPMVCEIAAVLNQSPDALLGLLRRRQRRQRRAQ